MRENLYSDARKPCRMPSLWSLEAPRAGYGCASASPPLYEKNWPKENILVESGWPHSTSAVLITKSMNTLIMAQKKAADAAAKGQVW